MQIAYEVLHSLSDGKFHSGTALAKQFKVSRSSVCKAIAFLRKLGLVINAVSGRGCRWEKPMELLNKNTILSQLTFESQHRLPRIDVVNVIPSTNDYLIQRLGHDIPSGTVCVAEGQSAGKGRMGRTWLSPMGANMYLSLYWRFPRALHDLSGLSLVASLAVLEGLTQIAPIPKGLGIKWPNDLWYHQSKLCGILTESVSKATLPTKPTFTDVIIGIGLNICLPNSHEGKLLERPTAWTDLNHVLGFTPSRNALIAYCLNALVPMLSQFEQDGFSGFTQQWSHYDVLYGKKITLFSSHEQQTGIAQGVNDRGELCVKVGETLKAVRCGEVSVRPEQDHQ